MSIRGYEVITLTNHWRIVGRTYYRDAIARRLSDGSVRLISIRDEA